MKSKRTGKTSASCRFCLDNMRTVSKDKKILVSASLSCADLLHVSDAIAQINASDIDFVHYDVAVSYTHLDVYKRQGTGTEGKLCHVLWQYVK